MKNRFAMLFVFCTILLGACGASPNAVSSETEKSAVETVDRPLLPTENSPAESFALPETTDGQETKTEGALSDRPGSPAAEPDPVPPSANEVVPNEPITKEEIRCQYVAAMTDLQPELQFNISGITWEFGAENDLKNLYYSVLAEHPELKYAYDMKVALQETTASCTFYYMPYVTNGYRDNLPAGSHTISSLCDLRTMAQSMTSGIERLPIVITDPTLLVDDMQRVLAQAGYGWIGYTLNREGTEIVAAPPVGKTLDECVSAINASFELCGDILSSETTPDMTEYEKIQALYQYIVTSVRYDFRYYSDQDNMPYESTVALGALRDHLAICGGYAQAFQMLLDRAGIENYTVSGVSSGEYHMWNYVLLDGEWYYCDPTADRGGMENHFMLTTEELNAVGTYSWDETFLEKITRNTR